MNVVQNGRKLHIVVVFEFESAFNRYQEAAKPYDYGYTFLLNSHYDDFIVALKELYKQR